ncbi:MAG: MiaB/RimO family radical SAM methylthiotransferase [Spirochaetes bacterium]|nr:MiaB/RimO family radical SAM methylthiotransferase [Spirochaetota bacterium]
MKIKITSLGCRLNRSEIESISTSLQEMGHEIVRGDDADLFIINSCVVTLKSERATVRHLRRYRDMAARRGGRVIMAGCASERLSREGGVFHVPNDYKAMIPEIIKEWEDFGASPAPDNARFDYDVPVRASTTRANLKIQDGCGNFCSYCIVPFVRGAPRSKPRDLVIAECGRLVAAGFREIVLTGVMIGNYSREGSGDGSELADLAGAILDIPGRFRLHLTSLMPVCVTPKLIELLGHERMVKHLHLSLQSGSNAVLGKMNRPYGREEYLALCHRLHAGVPDLNLTTDVIVGFPGETENDFLDTLGLVRDAGLSRVHVFRYSPRPGTAAAAMPDQIPEKVRRERSARLIHESEALTRGYHARFQGRRSLFLSERARGARTSGFNEYYLPIEVAGTLPRGEFYSVITRLQPEREALAGEVARE